MRSTLLRNTTATGRLLFNVLAHRFNSTTNYFKLFPQTFPNQGPPRDSFKVKARNLRREYRLLQSEHHPDVLADTAGAQQSSVDEISALVNRAYTLIRNPYTRIAAVIELSHPEKLDITRDEVAKKLIADIQRKSPADSLEYKAMLMHVLDAHEALELAELEADLEDLDTENESRISESEDLLDKLLQEGESHVDWDQIVIEAIKLKYWVNIQNGIKEWEQGKPVHLTH